MTDRELYEYLVKSGRNPSEFGFGQPSFIGQYRNADAALDRLNGLQIGNGENEISPLQKETYGSMFDSQKGQAVAGGILSGLSGLSTILNAANGLAQTNDMQYLYDQFDDVSRIGKTDYNSFDQLASDYSRVYTPSWSDSDIQSMTTGQKVGNVFSSTLAGATTGMTIGGPWGAAIGGVIGLGAGVGGWLVGDKRVRDEKRSLKNSALNATEIADVNLDAAHERTTNYKFRSGIGNLAARGGSIRRMQSLEEFTNSVLSKPKTRSERHVGVIRKHCNGGTMIRLKVK